MCVRTVAWKKRLITDRHPEEEEEMTTRYIRETMQTFESLGVQVDEMEFTKKHLRFFVRKGMNKTYFIRSCTPSDFRAHIKFKCQVKRWIKECEGIKDDA